MPKFPDDQQAAVSKGYDANVDDSAADYRGVKAADAFKEAREEEIKAFSLHQPVDIIPAAVWKGGHGLGSGGYGAAFVFYSEDDKGLSRIVLWSRTP